MYSFCFFKKNRVLILMVAVILAVIFLISNSSSRRIAEYSRYTVSENSNRISIQLSTTLYSAKNSITIVSNLASQSLTSTEPDKILEVLSLLLPTTPFSFIEYIDRDGINWNTTGEPFDASDRVYFKEGITGKSGVWINYHPKYASEYLINFYTPLYVSNRLAGVITGALSSKSDLLSLLKFSFFGYDMIGIICDEKQQVISSTLEFEGDTTLSEILASIGISEKWIDSFYAHISEKDSKVFRFDGKKGFSDACAYAIKQNGWSVIQIIPSPAFHKILYRSLYEEILAIAVIIIMFILYVVILKLNVKKQNRAFEMRQVELESETLHDKLTGLLNRRAFDKAIELLEASENLRNVCFCAFDVNGLKKINDTVGHDAGDELIKGASFCIRSVFGRVGGCYRIGGDEFAAIIQNPDVDFISLEEEFIQVQKEWKGIYIKEIAISMGTVFAADYPSYTAKMLLSVADNRMYEAKKDYYKTRLCL